MSYISFHTLLWSLNIFNTCYQFLSAPSQLKIWGTCFYMINIFRIHYVMKTTQHIQFQRCEDSFYCHYSSLLLFIFLTDLYCSIIASQCCQFLLYAKVNQPYYAYACPHIPSLLNLPPTLPIPPLQFIAKNRADLPVLCSCFPLANYFTFGSIYMSMLLSLRLSFPLPPCVLKSILYIYIFIPALQLGSSVPLFFFFRFHLYALEYSICFSLSDLLHSVSVCFY